MKNKIQRHVYTGTILMFVITVSVVFITYNINSLNIIKIIITPIHEYLK